MYTMIRLFVQLTIYVVGITNIALSEIQEISFVENGVVKSVINEGEFWSQGLGYIEATGVNHIIYGKQIIDTKDWEVNVQMELKELNATAASVVIGEENHLLFDSGRPSKIALEGPIWHDKSELSPAGKYIEAGKKFEVKIIKKDKDLKLYINNAVLNSITLKSDVVGFVGIRPHRNTVRLFNFKLKRDVSTKTIKQARVVNIPTLVVSDRRELHQVISDDRKKVYNGHPSTLRIPDSETILAIWTRGHGGTVEYLKRSIDLGNHWGDYLSLDDSWKKTNNCPSLHLLTDKLGKKRIFIFSGVGAMKQAYSENEGYNWTPMRSNSLTCIVAPASIIAINNGLKYRMYYHKGFRDTDTSPLTIWQADSTDGGLTWKDEKMVISEPRYDLCEPMVIKAPNGQQLLMLMRENKRVGNSLYSISDDEGATWSEVQELPEELTGDRHNARYALDGRLLIVFRDVSLPPKLSFGNLTLWVGKYENIIKKESGQYRVKVFHNMGGGLDSGYAGLEVLPDGIMLLTSYVKYDKNTDPPSIVTARLDIKKLDAWANLEMRNILQMRD